MNENLPQRPPNMGEILETNLGPLVTERAVPSYLGADDVAQRLHDGAVVLDVRPPGSILVEHVPGSIQVALSGKQFGTRVGFVVPADVSFVLVVEDEAQAAKAADALRVVAYDQVVGYSTLPSWKAAGRPTRSTNSISPQALYERLSNAEPLTVLDIREPNEWEEGHIEGATFVPYRELPRRLPEVPTDVPLAIICDAGHRSVIAASLLERAGVRNVLSVNLGMTGWRKAGLPEVTEETPKIEKTLA